MPRGEGISIHSDAHAHLLQGQLLGTLAETYPERMAVIKKAAPLYSEVFEQLRHMGRLAGHSMMGNLIAICWTMEIGNKATHALCDALAEWAEEVGLPVGLRTIKDDQVIPGRNMWVLGRGCGIASFLADHPNGDIAAHCYETPDPRILNPNPNTHEKLGPTPPGPSLAYPDIENEEAYLEGVLEAHRKYYREKAHFLKGQGYTSETRKDDALKKHLRWLAWYLVEGLSPELIEEKEGFRRGASASNITKALFGPNGLARVLDLVKETN